uniref:Ketoreductase n=1 Tax=Zygosaccharomyces rouxii TaxID=4956 RepID=Q9UV57_ZYGRO|nr:ketoreductase [Zygosaccharomyces rouxii]BBA54764.1 NADP dependent short chain dehydrogenase [synthetic construct]
MTKVFVTGANGFVAQHVVHQLLEKNYTVVGSVRSTEKGDKLAKLLNNPKFSYEIIKDMVNSRDEFDKALQKHSDVEIVLHTASPVFPGGIKDVEKEMIQPAVNGTRNVLLSIKDNLPNVKRFVYTSSLAAVRTEGAGYSADEVVTEDSWNNIALKDATKDEGTAYEASKTYGEKEVWNFFEKTKNVNFDFAIINPVYVFGPQLFEEYVTDKLNFSSEIINSIIKGEKKEIEGYEIDVRDIARAHISAVENPATTRQRLIPAVAPYNQQTILDVLNENFPELKGKIDVGKPGSQNEFIKKYYKLDNSKTKKVLGFEFISQEQTIKDAAAQILSVKNGKK